MMGFTQRREADEELKTIEAVIDGLRSDMAMPEKPSSFVLAQRNLLKLRREQSELQKQLNAAHRKDRDNRKDRSSNETKQFIDQLTILNEEVGKAHAALDAERERFQPIFMRQIGSAVMAYEELLNHLINLNDEVLSVALSLNNHAALNELRVHRSVADAPALVMQIRDMRRIIRGS